jgi:hypothetical protein
MRHEDLEARPSVAIKVFVTLKFGVSRETASLPPHSSIYQIVKLRALFH